MNRNKAYLVGTHRYSYRAGIPAEIIGVNFCCLNDGTYRLCYHLLWDDFSEDWISVEEGRYKIITFGDIIKGNIPRVTD